MLINRFVLPLAAALWIAALATGVSSAAPEAVAPAPAPSPAAVATAHAQPQPPAPTAAAPAAPGQEYAGADTCIVCHEGLGTGIDKSKHGFKANARTPMAQQGCESCHGPGAAHAADPEKVKPLQFAKLATAEANAACTTCHNRAKHALWDGSQHDQRNVDVHRPATACTAAKSPTRSSRRRTRPALCGTCHRTDRQQAAPLQPHAGARGQDDSARRATTCTASTNVKLLKVGTTIDESCTSCHAEKRGPYLWEHAPVVESCVTCHDPHGSNNDRMLVAKPPFLCQRCHVTSRHPPTVYDGFLLNNSQNANKIYGEACVNCHQQMHGSNHPVGQDRSCGRRGA